MRRILACFVLLMPALARGGEMAAALRDHRWADADAFVAASPDPVARKLVLYERLLSPGGGSAAEIAGFLAVNTGWPNAALLVHRLAEALAAEPDNDVVQDLCISHPPHESAALLRCAAAQASPLVAGEAWVAGITGPAQEQAFLLQWGATLTPDQQWRRFDRLAWSDGGAAATRQVGRLPPSQRARATARLALRRDDPSGRVLANAIPNALTTDPALMLELARFLRRTGQDVDAQALWLSYGATAERAAPPDRRPAFWTERDVLARHRLRDGDPAGAYALVDSPPGLAPAQATDAEFLAGFVALRRLNDPAAAARHFRALATLGRAALTQARASYWLGRTAAARGDAAAAHAAYLAGAAWPTTFYGQLAARAAGETDAALAARIRVLHDPAWSPAEALTILGSETARAATLLAAWGLPREARAYLLRLDEQAVDGAGHALAAKLATDLGLVDLAVADARRAGQYGTILAESGWPLLAIPPSGGVEPALTLGLIRQESSFNPEALSPSGARGLMQLMPATAQAVAHLLGDGAANPSALTSDPAYNMRLGTTYLAGLLGQFGGAVPLAVAAYNAGPNRVGEWLATIGDPASPAITMLDWIELIPFGETRNYVQRVIENVVVYRARTGLVLPHPLARWLG